MAESFFFDASKQWQALMQQAGGPWSEFLRMGAQSPEAFDTWSKTLAGGTGAVPGETIERLIRGARDYMSFMQSSLGAMPAGMAGATGWGEQLKSLFAMPGAAAAFGHPLAGNGPSLQSPAALFGAMGIPAGMPDFKSWLALPAFGLTREHQEHHQKTLQAWLDYQQQFARHNEQMAKAAQRGFELFEGKLAEREQPGRQIESLRALYDVWVDAAEEGYAEVALSQEYREAYGALVNAQMRLRAQVQQDVARLSAELGVPTRSEVDSIGERLQALRREVRALRGGDALVDDIAQLRSELETLVHDTVHDALGSKPRAEATASSHRQATGKRKPKTASSTAAAPRRTVAARGKPKRAAAAVSPSGFATRIAQFADASLGGKRSKRSPANTAGKPGGKKR